MNYKTYEVKVFENGTKEWYLNGEFHREEIDTTNIKVCSDQDNNNHKNVLLWLGFCEKLEPPILTYFAESIGYMVLNSYVAIKVLFSLTNHKSALVREGAIYGLSYYLPNQFVYNHLKKITRTDSSKIVREIAKDTLEE